MPWANLVCIGDGEDDGVELLQLLQIVRGDVTQLDTTTGWGGRTVIAVRIEVRPCSYPVVVGMSAPSPRAS